MSLALLGLCFGSSKCPLRKAYSYKPVVAPDPDVVRRTDEESLRAGGAEGETPQLERSGAPLFHDSEDKTDD